MDGNFFQSWLWQTLSAYIMPWTATGISWQHIFLNWLIFFAFQTAILWGIAHYIVKRHEQSLALREKMDHRPLITTLPDIPDGYGDPAMICASAIISHAKVRSFPIIIHSLIGGNIRTLEHTLNRARREALLRLEEEALSRRADMVVNLRFTSHGIGLKNGNNLAVEIVACGTALHRS